MAHRPKTRRLANVFGALGYLSCCIQWMLAFAVLVLPAMEGEGFREVFMPTAPVNSVGQSDIALPPILQMIIIVAAVVFSLAVMIYAIISIPRAVGRTGSKVTHETAKVAVRQIIHHKPLTRKQEKTFVERITWSIKLLLVLIPSVLLLIPVAPRYGVTQDHILIAGAFCACLTLFWFGIQYLVARLTKLDPRNVW